MLYYTLSRVYTKVDHFREEAYLNYSVIFTFLHMCVGITGVLNGSCKCHHLELHRSNSKSSIGSFFLGALKKSSLIGATSFNWRNGLDSAFVGQKGGLHWGNFFLPYSPPFCSQYQHQHQHQRCKTINNVLVGDSKYEQDATRRWRFTGFQILYAELDKMSLFCGNA